MVYGGDGYYENESIRGMGMSFDRTRKGDNYRMTFGGYVYGGTYEKNDRYLYTGGFGYMGAEYVIPYENLEFFFGIQNGLGLEVGPYVETLVYSYDLRSSSSVVIVPRATWTGGISIYAGSIVPTIRLSLGLPTGISMMIHHESGLMMDAGVINMNTSPGERLMWYLNIGMAFR